MKIPRPNEYCWLTSKHVHREEDYFHLMLIQVKDVWFNEEINEWMVNTEDNTYWAADCKVLDEDITNEIIAVLD